MTHITSKIVVPASGSGSEDITQLFGRSSQNPMSNNRASLSNVAVEEVDAQTFVKNNV